MSEYVCPGCRAHNMTDECWHTARMWSLAEALADGLPGGPATWGTPADRAWAFIDDAEGLDGDVGEPPYRVTMFHPSGSTNVTTIGLVNGRYLFAVDEETDFLGDVHDDEGRARLVMPMLGSSEPEMRCPGCDCEPVGYAPHNGKGDCPPRSTDGES